MKRPMFPRQGDAGRFSRAPRPVAGGAFAKTARTLLLLLILGLAGCSASQAPQNSGSSSSETTTPGTPASGEHWDFEDAAAGQLPAGATAFGGTWAVRGEPGAPSGPKAVCQTGQAAYPALRLSSHSYANAALSTSFKPISGHEDQAAGLIFRVQDERNYYILRANALEQTVQFFRYVHGNRIEMRSAHADVPTGSWQTLKVESSGSTMRGYLGGRLVVQDADSSFPAGGVGLWTKADSVTCFDNVDARPQ